jgi:uncharacterized protein (DUF1015 family)
MSRGQSVYYSWSAPLDSLVGSGRINVVLEDECCVDLDEHLRNKRKRIRPARKRPSRGTDREMAIQEKHSRVDAFVVALDGYDDYLLLRRPAPARAESDSVVEGLDVSALHHTLLTEVLEAACGKEGEIRYSADAAEVFQRIDSGKAAAAFFMRPMLAEQMSAACMAGELMPQKSTYFFPKLLTGLVFHSLES